MLFLIFCICFLTPLLSYSAEVSCRNVAVMLFIQSVGMIGNSLGYDFDSNSEEQGECCCLFAGIKFRIFLLLELIKSH
jgi:hypothetical protein